MYASEKQVKNCCLFGMVWKARPHASIKIATIKDKKFAVKTGWIAETAKSTSYMTNFIWYVNNTIFDMIPHNSLSKESLT